MSDDVSAVRSLFDECYKSIPDMIKIDECIIRCCNKEEDINTLFEDTMSPLHNACFWGHYEIVKRLVEKSDNFKYPVDVNAISGRLDCTPLEMACLREHPLTVRALLLHPNIEINRVDSLQRTPLDLACCMCYTEIRKEVVIELLKHPNVNSNVKNYMGATPLHIACLNNGSAAVVQLLLNHGTINDINATDIDGNTPLHNASYYFSKDKVNIIRNLLTQPLILINMKNKNNETPLEIVKKRLNVGGYYHNYQIIIEIIQLIEDYQNKQRWQSFYFFLMNYEY